MIKCPNCGSENKEGTKFCTKCGTRLAIESEVDQSTSAQANPAQTNERIQEFKKHSMNYFGWFSKAIKHPTIVSNESKYYGLTTLILNSALLALMLHIIGNQALSTFNSAANGLSSLFGAAEPVSTAHAGISVYIRLLIIIMLYMAAFVLSGFVTRKYVMKDNVNVYDYMNQLGSYITPMLVVDVISVVILWLSKPDATSITGVASAAASASLFTLTMLFLLLLWTSAFFGSMLITNEKTRIDGIYAIIISQIIGGIAVFFVSKIIMNTFTYMIMGAVMIPGIL